MGEREKERESEKETGRERKREREITPHFAFQRVMYPIIETIGMPNRRCAI